MVDATTSPSLPDRMIRAARLSVPLYEEVEADTRATTQALTVVVIVSVASGIGQGLATMGQPGGNLIGGVIGGVISGLIGWAVGSWVIYFIGTRMFGGTATYGELLRTLGFADSPGVLQILAFIPVLGPLISLVAGLWVLAAFFIGTRQALDISSGKTVGVLIVALIAVICVFVVVGLILAAIGLGAMAGAGLLRP
jgi:hypothetical protein